MILQSHRRYHKTISVETDSANSDRGHPRTAALTYGPGGGADQAIKR